MNISEEGVSAYINIGIESSYFTLRLPDNIAYILAEEFFMTIDLYVQKKFAYLIHGLN